MADHADVTAALANLAEFAESMPTRDERGYLPNIDYDYTCSVGRLRELLAEASDLVDKMTR